MPVVRAANAEPLPGYRLLEPLGRGGFGEVWKCQAPGGFHKAIKFVGGGNTLHGDNSQAIVRQEIRALQLLKTLRHPFLLSVERVEVIDGELLILTELADCSLHDLLERCQNTGQPGIPRDELLEFFREAAEVLDVMNQDHGLQHLDIKPRNLFLSGNHVKVGDFGLVGSLAEFYGPEGVGGQLEMVSPLYASPERFASKVSLYSDQYSLAVSYVELLTGQLPFPGKTYHALAQQHTQDDPDLGPLPETDRAALRRALAKEPAQRFPSCLAFIHTLLYPGAESTRELRAVRRHITPLGTPRVPPVQKPPTKSEVSLGDVASTALVPEKTQPVKDLRDKTPTRNVPVVRAAPTTPGGAAIPDPLDGWTYLDCLGRFPYGEFWRVRPPAGPDHLVKLVFGFEARKDASGRDPLDRLRKLSHPTLVPTEYLPTYGRLVIRSRWPERTLVEGFEAAVAAGQNGIPRAELLDHLDTIAEVLDHHRERAGLMHLGLNPRLLVLGDDDRIRLADLGLVEVVWQPAGQNPAALNTRYAAPELFAGKPDVQSDQYSLAVLYAELLTGGHPFRNLNQRQLGNLKARAQPELSMVPAKDRAILLTALELEPRYRFGCCREFVAALRSVSSEQGQRRTLRQASTPLPPLLRRPALDRVARQLTEAAAGGLEVREFGQQRYLLRPGEMIAHHCFARIVASTMLLKLEGFRERWRAVPISANGTRFQYQIRVPPSLLDRIFGRHPGLDTFIALEETSQAGATLTSVSVELRPSACGKARAVELLEEMGPPVLDSLRNYLQAAPERRKQERFRLEHPVTVYPLLADDELGEGVLGQAHDISLSGLGLYLPRAIESDTVAVHVRVPGSPGYLLAAHVVRQAACRDGRHNLGLCFGDLPLT